MKIIKGGVTAPKGFLANGICIGHQAFGQTGFGYYCFRACRLLPPVFLPRARSRRHRLVVSMKHIKKGISRAVLVNSGNANCYTGKSGLKHAQGSTELSGQTSWGQAPRMF